MKINLTRDMGTYYVDEKKGKVVCVFEETAPMFIYYAEQNLRIKPSCDSENVEQSRLYQKLLMPNRFTGIATCNPKDEFSVEHGKLIAFSKAKDKIQRSFFKRADLYVRSIDDWLADAVDSINKYGEKLEKNTEKRHKRISDIVGEKE